MLWNEIQVTVYFRVLPVCQLIIQTYSSIHHTSQTCTKYKRYNKALY